MTKKKLEHDVNHIERVDAWGGAKKVFAYVHRPIDIKGIQALFDLARTQKRSIALRGSGCSYGDAALNEQNLILDLTHFNQIIKWDAKKGIVTAQSGVTIRQLWQATIESGWWPPVVSGTMEPTLGGVLSMNIHGKNNFKVGPIGNHVLSFDLLLPTGEIKTCTPKENKDLFYATIGGFGMLGVFVSITVQMKKIHSGYLSVEAITAKNLDEMFAQFEKNLPDADYLVGWIDAVRGGKRLGRGIIHRANYLAKGEDKNAHETLQVSSQGLPNKIMGIFPKDLTWIFMRPMINNIGMRFMNWSKYLSACLSLRGLSLFANTRSLFIFIGLCPQLEKGLWQRGTYSISGFYSQGAGARCF